MKNYIIKLAISFINIEYLVDYLLQLLGKKARETDNTLDDNLVATLRQNRSTIVDAMETALQSKYLRN